MRCTLVLVLVLSLFAANLCAATVESAADGNWSVGATWVGGTKPQPGDTADINATHDVTLDEDFTGNITGSAATGSIIVSGTRVITGNVTYTGTSTAGLIIVGAGDVLTVTGLSTGGAAGYVYVQTDGTLNLGNVSETSTGRVVSSTGGALNQTGTVGCSGAGYGLYVATNCVVTQSGVITVSSGYGLYFAATVNGSTAGNHSCSAGTGCVVVGGGTGTLAFTGNPVSTAGAASVIRATGGTVNWTGASTIAAGAYAYIYVAGGTLDTTGLVLANSGNLCILHTTGTITQGTGTITNQSTAAGVAVTGTELLTVTGPTLPDVANVWTGTGTYGYAGSPLTPTKRASSIANCSAVNVRAGITIDDVVGTYVRPPLIRARR